MKENNSEKNRVDNNFQPTLFNMLFRKKLARFTVIQGPENSGKITNAIDITRPYKHETSLIDIFEGDMKNGIIPGYRLKKDLKAIILLNVLFPVHTKSIQALIEQTKISFTEPGNNKMITIDFPALIVSTCSEKEKIPFDIFPGKVHFLQCG